MRDWKDRKLIAKAAKHKNITPKRQLKKKKEKWEESDFTRYMLPIAFKDKKARLKCLETSEESSRFRLLFGILNE